MGHDVFISHSTKDKKVSDAVCALLERRGYRCWVAPRDILPGQEWGEAIIDGIRNGRVFVLVFSGHANSSQQVRREVERAVGHGLPIIPFRIEDVAPAKSLEYFISNQHWLDALTPPMERHLNYLGDVVGRLLADDRASAAAPAGRAPAIAASPRAGPAWALWALLLVLAAIAGATGYLLSRNGGAATEGNGLAANGLVGDNRNETEPVVAPPPQLEPMLDFGRVPVSTEPDGLVDAAPYLLRAAISTQASASPAEARLVFLDRANLQYLGPSGYGGYFEIEPSGSNLLVLQSRSHAPAYLQLGFAEPLAEVRLTLPRVRPRPVMGAGASGTSFPAITASALDERGQELVQRAYPAWRSSDLSAPEQITIVLTAPGREGIRALRLRVDGVITTDTNPYAPRAADLGGGPAPPPPPPPYNATLIVEKMLARRMPAAIAPAR